MALAEHNYYNKYDSLANRDICVFALLSTLAILYFLTRSFLLKDEEPPMRIGCDELLTVEHISLTCSDLIGIRENHFTAQSLRVLFQDISPENFFKLFERNQ